MITRRDLLKQCGAGFGSIALSGLLADLSAEARAKGEAQQDDGLAPRPPRFPARAKRVIFLFMHGGPSAVDTFDYKPLLLRDDGKPLPFAKPRVVFAQTNNLLRSPWEFRQHGQSGAWISSLFPNVARYADDLAIVKSLHGSNPAHGGACLKIHTGSDTFVRPSLGAWVSYGLGTENRNLPGFITLNPTLGHGGVQNFGAGFLPAIHQGTRIALPNEPKAPITIPNATNPEVTADDQRIQLDLLHDLERLQTRRTGADAALEARIESFELAFRMQSTAPGVMDLNGESESTKKLYGLGVKPTDAFARQCLLARRFAEAGVRFIQVTHGYWDQHSELKSKHGELAAEVDRPIAALLGDLKARGLLDDTLVIWGGEFGRTPVAEGKDGRDHNPHGFTWWMAGGGVKGGLSFGSTDDYGFYAAEDKVHVHDLHATILHLLGLDHLKLTFRHAGRDFRLTDVEGHVVHELLA